MATLAFTQFKPFQPYTYVPTPPRSKSTNPCRKPVAEQHSILNKVQQIRSSSTHITPPAAVAAADDDEEASRPGIRGTSTFYKRSGDANGNENNDDDDRDHPTIEELLLTKLEEQGFRMKDQGLDKTDGVEGLASKKNGSSVSPSRLAQSDDSHRSLDDSIDLLGDNNSSASVAKFNVVSLDAGLFDSLENAVDSTTPASPCSFDGWHDIDDFHEIVPRLAEQGASMSSSTRPHTPSSCLSSEPLHDSISREGSHGARSEVTTYSSSPAPSHCRASSEPQLIQERRLRTSQGVADEHKLVESVLETFPINRGAMEQQQEVEQENVDNNSGDQDKGPQQEVNSVAVAAMAERIRDANLPCKEDGSARSAERQHLLPNRDPSPEPSQDGLGSDSCSDDELNIIDSEEDDKEPRPAKRKRLSSSCNGPMHKKRKHSLQQRSTRQSRPHLKLHRHRTESHSRPDQGMRNAKGFSGKDRLPSPTPSTPQMLGTKTPPNYSNPSRASSNISPTLTEITFRPYSQHCYSFTAVIREGFDRRGVSFSQVAQLIESIGYVGKIDDLTIKPSQRHSFLLTGFSRHTSSQISSGEGTVSTTGETTRTRPQDGRAVDAGAVASRSEPSSSDDDGGLSNTDLESSSDDDGCSSGKEQGRSSMSKHSRWDDLDEQRLLAYKKEDKSWDWIFKKFPGRTPGAIRTRCSMLQKIYELSQSQRRRY